jgi:hypothetical protein
VARKNSHPCARMSDDVDDIEIDERREGHERAR